MAKEPGEEHHLEYLAEQDSYYLDSFQSLVSNTNYFNPRTLVVKFQKKLQTSIQNQITTMLVECSRNMDLETQYKTAKRVNQAYLVNEALQFNQ